MKSSGPDYSLPPCIYPASRPYNGFSTLLHRFGRYERIRNAHMKEQQITAAVAMRDGEMRGDSRKDIIDDVSTASDGERGLRQGEEVSVGGNRAPLSQRSLHPKQYAQIDIPTSLNRTTAIDTASSQLSHHTIGELMDQRVALTPRQEIKLELARLGAMVEKQVRKQHPIPHALPTAMPNVPTLPGPRGYPPGSFGEPAAGPKLVR